MAANVNAWLNPSKNPWYDPGSIYGGKGLKSGRPQDYYDTPIVRDDKDDHVVGEWTRWLSGQGLTGQDNRSRFAQNQRSTAQAGWEAAKLSNPSLRWRQYLNDYLNPSTLSQGFDQLTASQRGVDPQSRTSVIRWG